MTKELNNRQREDIAIDALAYADQLADLSADQVKVIAGDLNLKINRSKRDLITALVEYETRRATRAAETANADVDARAAGFTDSAQQLHHSWAIEKLTKAVAEGKGSADAFIAQIASYGGRLNRALGWAEGYVQAEAAGELAGEILATATALMSDGEDYHGKVRAALTNPADALAQARQNVVVQPLISNRYRGGSTSAFSNAVEAATRAAASDLAERWAF